MEEVCKITESDEFILQVLPITTEPSPNLEPFEEVCKITESDEFPWSPWYYH
jgi:hypothetical protein